MYYFSKSPKWLGFLLTLPFAFLVESGLSQITVNGATETGAVPFTPSWSRGAGSLLDGLSPSTTAGNFGQFTGGAASNLTQAGNSLTIYPYSSPQANKLQVAGNNGTAGSLLVYTLPASSHGYDLSKINVYGGWQDSGRDAQAFTVSYSTVANPSTFVLLAQVDYSPANVPGGVASASRTTIADASGGKVARNVAALRFDFTAPASENGAVGYTAITVEGVAATEMGTPPISLTFSNQRSEGSFTPTWPIESDSLIAGKLPAVSGPGNFTGINGVSGPEVLTNGSIGETGTLSNFTLAGASAGQSVTYALGNSTLTGIVMYSGWSSNSRDGQFSNIFYSTVEAPSTFVPLVTGIAYNPGVTGHSANRVAVEAAPGNVLARNVAFLKFDFTPQTAGLDNGYSGYAEIIVKGAANSGQVPIFGTSPIPEPYPYVSGGSFSGPAVPLSPDPLVSYRWPNPTADDGLEIYLRKPVVVEADNAGSFTNLQSLTSDNPNVTVNGVGSIRMDFGVENAAWLEFDSPDLPSSAQVEMSISEYNQPAITMDDAEHHIKTLKPIKYGNTYRLELNSELYEGVRFGWIHVRSNSSSWHITGVRLVCQTKPVNYNGSFSCSDQMLTRIWYTGAYTVKLNLLKNEFSAILMDRGDRFSWTGDAYVAQAAALTAFGNWDFIKKNIDRTANDTNGIESYSLYWVLSLIDYFDYSGDRETMNRYITNAVAKLDHAYAIFGTNPNLGFYGWDERIGAGFENASCPESQKAYQMLSVRAWREFASAMQAMGRQDLSAKYSGYASQKMASLRQNSSWFKTFGMHACADAVGTALLTNVEKDSIFAQQFADRVNRLSYSPFNQYFVIGALAEMGRYDDALNSIDDLWGSEIRYGGTTFFEVSRPSWNQAIGVNDPVPNGRCGFTSLCHPWSAGVTKWLSEEVLGIKPASPGFDTYRIAPHLGRKLTNVSGTTPTPHGEIKAKFNIASGVCEVEAPQGTVGTICIPKAEKTVSKITIDGDLAWNGTFLPVAGVGGAGEDSEFVYFTDVQPGRHSFVVTYSGATPNYYPPPVRYAGQAVKEDAVTSGNWGGVYGSEGYVLCNYLGNRNDKRSLPSYVSSVSYSIWGAEPPPATVWNSGTTDSRALPPDATNQGTRKAACYYTEGTHGIRNSMAFTVRCKETRPYQIALYFVDWDRAGRSIGVSMHDAATLDLIAPQKVVEDFAGGKYLIYSYNKSATFRIEQVRGDNAVLSGIFFDPAPFNTAPVLNEIGDKSIYSGQIKRFSPDADDAQNNYQTLTYSLIEGPPGAEIDPSSGEITWATNPDASGSYQFTVRVTDSGIPPLSTQRSFSINVFSQPQVSAVTADNDRIKMVISAFPGQEYQLQSSKDLIDWVNIGNRTTGVSGSLDMSAPIDPEQPRYFYRIVARNSSD
jgi:hypothetical protein